MTKNTSVPTEKTDKDYELGSVAAEVLQQSKALLESLPDALLFTKESVFVPKSNIAKHVRHLVDHYRLLLVNKPDTPCIQNGQTIWAVDYDSRDRNVPMETDKQIAIQEIEKLQTKILNNTMSLDTPVRLLAIVNSTEDKESEFLSNYGRELWFCIHHAIHHHALIKVICIEHKIDIPEEFGVAPSTQKHYQKS
ncbi:hypothetical protein K7432_000163 [Basidiobolus ranarum]|uniref:DinB-like domain-containing protein n=1 Tax=Basidiobolus ranarum TaxID=34480 RepID=A0ABR2WBQ8_9FUNG